MTACDTVGRSNVSYLCQGLLMASRTQQGRRLKADPGRSRCTQSSVRSLRNMKPSLRWQCDKMGWLEGNRYRMDLHGFLIHRWKPDGWVEVLAEVLYLATSGTPLVALRRLCVVPILGGWSALHLRSWTKTGLASWTGRCHRESCRTGEISCLGLWESLVFFSHGGSTENDSQIVLMY